MATEVIAKCRAAGCSRAVAEKADGTPAVYCPKHVEANRERNRLYREKVKRCDQFVDEIASGRVIEPEKKMSELSKSEAAELAKLEGVIAAGLDGFVAVGEALASIRDSKLYRRDHDTFEAYCQARWEFSRSYAFRLIQSAEVVSGLLPMGNKDADSASKTPIPDSERVAREVAKAPKAKREKVWKEAVASAPKGGDGKPKVTAAHVKRVVAEAAKPAPAPTPDVDFFGNTDDRPINAPAKPAPPPAELPVDKEGHPIADPKIAAVFAGLDELAGLVRQLAILKSTFEKAREQGDPRYRLMGTGVIELVSLVDGARRQLHDKIPYSLCPYHGSDPTATRDCKACGGGGYVTKSTYRQAPESMRLALKKSLAGKAAA